MEPKGRIRPRDGKLEAVLRMPDGRKVRRSTGLDVGQEDEAQAVLVEALRQLRERALPAAGADLTVRRWGAAWIEDRKARDKREWVNEQTHLEAFVYPRLGDLPLQQVTDVAMLDWLRVLPKGRGPSGKTPSPKYVRKIAGTVRLVFKDAVRRHLLERTPCIWENGDLPEPEANARVIGAGFELAEVKQLVSDQRVPEDRRVLYALEFLTGMRTGEAAARRWEDWEESYRGDLGRLVVKTAYNTRHRLLKDTKTSVEKWLPVHPALAVILARWRAEGWERFWGRAPRPEDLVVPSARGNPRNNSYSWQRFKVDLETLGLKHQRHYETRSTFINLAEAGGASPDDVHRLTHASVGEAKDLYRRVPQLWPRLCAAVRCIALPPPDGEVTARVTAVLPEDSPDGGSLSEAAGFGETMENGRARAEGPPASPRRSQPGERLGPSRSR